MEHTEEMVELPVVELTGANLSKNLDNLVTNICAKITNTLHKRFGTLVHEIMGEL